MNETQHQRTQLAWTRTGLSLGAVGLAEVRVLVGPSADRALVVLAAGLALVVVLGTAGATRLGRTRDALRGTARPVGGRTPALISATAVLIALLGLTATLARP